MDGRLCNRQQWDPRRATLQRLWSGLHADREEAMNDDFESALTLEWFNTPGSYVLVDGQFGSTGKGVIAAALAEHFYDRVDLVISNAGPNSGHTSVHDKELIILKQLPTFGVIAGKMGRRNLPVYLSGGAVIDPAILVKELDEFSGVKLFVHPNAAIIDDYARKIDGG